MNKKVRDQTDRCPMPKRNKTRHAAHEEEMDEVDDMDFVGCKNLGMKEVMMMKKMEENVKEEDDCYKMNHTHRGNAVIFYHENFENKDLRTRTGVEDDVNTLRRSLEKLGFQVDSHKDLTYDEIKGVLVKVAKKNHSNNDCLLVAVMTHGRGRDYIHAKDEEYRTSELWETFNHKSCPTLEGKPKIFFVQIPGGLTNMAATTEGEELCQAASGGFLDRVETLLDEGAEPNQRNCQGSTALMIAAEQDHMETVKVLLEKGADPNVQNPSGGTALNVAAARSRLETVKLLLEHGADPSINNAHVAVLEVTRR